MNENNIETGIVCFHKYLSNILQQKNGTRIPLAEYLKKFQLKFPNPLADIL